MKKELRLIIERTPTQKKKKKELKNKTKTLKSERREKSQVQRFTLFIH